MKKIILISVFWGFAISSFSQSLNKYKYIIVPQKFDFLSEADQYQLNSLTKFLFDKYGFTAVLDNEELPNEVAVNNCLALRANVVDKKSFLQTKLQIELKDCFNKIIFTSKEGVSTEKQHKTSYNLALRDAFKSFKEVEYSYTPDKLEHTPLIGKDTTTVLTSEAIIEAAEQEAVKVVEKISKENKIDILYAQEIISGYQLVDSTPKVIYKLKPTQISTIFLVEELNGVLYKQDTHWILNYYNNEILQTKILNIKF